MTEAFSFSSSVSSNELMELILSFEHCVELTPETPKLSYQSADLSHIEAEMLDGEFMLSESSGYPDDDDHPAAQQSRRVKRRITKRKDQKARAHGKVSL